MAKIRPVLRMSAAALVAAGLTVIPATSSHAATPAACSSFDAGVTQLVRPTSGANLLTRSEREADIAAQQYGFTEQHGVLAQVATSAGDGLAAVWRLYKSGDFVWATDGQDVEDLKQQGYLAQRVDFYAATESQDCLGKVYRFKRGNIHRMADEAEAKTLSAAGWSQEKVAFYADTDQTDPAPAPDPGPQTGSTFSIAVLPDTQNESNSATDTRFKNRAQWLADNKQALNLRYAIQVGDIVNWGSAVPAQFTKISTDIKPLEQAVPWAGAIGNHDTAAVCPGGSACPGTSANVAVRDTTAYNAAFPTSRFPDLAGTFEPGKVDNAYRTFSAGGDDWLVLSLELWPRTAAVNWAKQVVASHPDDNVIVVTHAYLEDDGSISRSNGGYGANSPQYLYDNLIKVYPNIKMVLSGHVGLAASRTDTGNQGNKILSLLQTFHSSTNPVRVVKIDTSKDTVSSTIYAPATKTDYPEYATSTSGMDFISR